MMAPLSIFVPGPLNNPMNGPRGGHWAKHARWARNWRERTAQRLWLERRQLPPPSSEPREPKRVTFTLQTWNRVDDDALGPMAKPCRDALIDAGLLHSDAPNSGHDFVYAQVVNRKERGIRITVEAIHAGT
jgi:hypothetical protein